MKRCIFLYRERPHITAVPILLKESSSNVMSLASLATEVPVPIESPTCAWFNAGASFVPSPVTATTAPFCCNSCTRRCLSYGACTRHYLQVHHTVQCLLIRQFGKCSSRNAVLFRILRFPQTNLACYLGSRTRCISRHNLHSDTCRLAFGNGRRHIRTDRVTDGNHTEERQVIFSNQ